MEFNPKNVHYETCFPFCKGRLDKPVNSAMGQEISITFPDRVAEFFNIDDQLKLKDLPSILLDFEIHYLDQRPQFSLKCPWLPDNFLDYLSGKIQATFVPDVDYESTLWSMEKCLNEELKKLMGIVLKYDFAKFSKAEGVVLMDVIEENDLLYYYGWIENVESSKEKSPSSCVSCSYDRSREVRPKTPLEKSSLLDFFKNFLTRKLDEMSYYYGIFEDDIPKVLNTKTAQSYLCNICFLDVSKESCIKLNCSHVFCKVCLNNYFKSKIEIGNVLGMMCPYLLCNVKIGNMTSSILDSASFEQFKKLVFETKIKMNPVVSECVRCQGVAYALKRGSNSFHCSNCHLEFCKKCGKKYHGDQMCLSLEEKQQNMIAWKYANSSLSEKAEMEIKYTKESLSNWLHNRKSLFYIDKNYKACPNCCTKIELMDGCNKVRCKLCHVTFCYNCLRILDVYVGQPANRRMDIAPLNIANEASIFFL